MKLTVKLVSIWVVYSLYTSLCSIGNNSLTPESEGAELQCLPLYSILLALGNPTVHYFRQAVNRLVTDNKGLTQRWALTLANRSTTPAAKFPPVSTTPVANLPLVSTIPAANFGTNFTSVVDTGGKFATSNLPPVNNTGGKLPPVSMTQAENLPPVANNGINIRLQIP